MLILFMALVGVVTLVVQLKESSKKMQPLKLELERQKYESYIERKGAVAVNVGVIVFSVISIIFGSVIQYDEVSIGLGIILAFLGLGELLQLDSKYKVYYNEERIIVNGLTIRFRSIKKITQAKPKFLKNYVVHTLNGQSERIAKVTLDKIQQHKSITVQ